MNKNLVITGASRGIGRACIFIFAQAGYNIYFCSKNEKNIQELITEIRNTFPNISIKGKAVDVGIKSEVILFGKWIVDEIAHVDVLINNAGIFIPGLIQNEEDGKLEEMLQINVMSAYHLTRFLLPIMKNQERAYIFNMCSVASLMAYPQGGSYSISKYALLGFSDNLRKELMDMNIAVTAVLPGATMTASWEGTGVDISRIMEAKDVAKMILACTELSPHAVVEKIVMKPQLGDL